MEREKEEVKLHLNKNIWIFAVFLILLTPSAAAVLKTHSYDKETKTYTIYDWGGLDKLISFQLVKNTDYCLENCYAIIKVMPDNDLEDVEEYDWKFYNKHRKSTNKIKEWKLYRLNYEDYEVEVTDYGTCTGTRINNATGEEEEYEYTCPIGTHTETRQREVWDEYNFNPHSVKAGKDFYIKLVGKKDIYADVDWVPTFLGFDLDEWAWWNSSYDYKRDITTEPTSDLAFAVNGTEGFGGNIIWTNPSLGNLSLYYNNESFYAVAVNDTSEGYYETEGGGLNNSITSIYSSNAKAVYHFGTSGSAEDSTTNNNDGTVNGATWTSSGMFGGAYGFNGTAYISGTDIYDSGDFSVSLWLKFNGTLGSYQGIIGQNKITDVVDKSWHIQKSSSDTFVSRIYVDSETALVDCNSVGAISTNTWYHLVLTYEDSLKQCKLYVNGIENVSNTGSGTPVNPTVPLWIGKVQTNYWIGTIDEVRFYNRVLTATEIQELYNNSQNLNMLLGAEETLTGVSVELVSPIDGYYNPIDNTTFICNSTATGGAELGNVTLFIWNETGSLYYQDTVILSGANATTEWNVTDMHEGNNTWTCQVWDSTGTYNDTAPNRTIVINTIPPIINITSPTGEYQTFSLPINVSLNFTIAELHLDSCWYSTSWNSTNVTIDSCTTGENNLTITANTTGWQAITVYANDSANNIGNDTTTFLINLLSYNTTFTDNLIETQPTTYTLVVDATNITDSNATFIWNNTAYGYAAKTQTATQVTFTKNITMPFMNNLTNIIPIYWNYTINNGTIYSTSVENQTIHQFLITDNDSISTTATLNFTIMDELTDNPLNGTLDMVYDYYAYSSSARKNLSYSYSNLNNKILYIYPSWASIYIDAVIEYGADNYSDRMYYFDNSLLNNQTQDIALRLLSDTEAVKFFFTLKKTGTILTDATITINKYFVGEGTYKTVGKRKSDENGEFIEYLDLDKEYQFIVTENGNVLGTIERTALCAEAPCNMVLEVAEVIVDPWQIYDSSIGKDVQYTFSYNTTTNILKYTFVDLTGGSNFNRLQVDLLRWNETAFTVCNKNLTATSGSILCNVSAYSGGDFTAKAYISRSPEVLVDIWKFKDASLAILGEDGIFFTLIMIVTIGFVGIWNPVVGIALLAFSFFIAQIMGFTTFSLGTAIIIVGWAIYFIWKVKS